MRNVNFLIDEAASLGPMECIDDAIDKYRGYGIRMQLYYQSLGQLKTCFPKDQGQVLISNASQIYMGMNDYETADQVSRRLGEQTITVESGGFSRGTSINKGRGHSGASHSSNMNRNWNQVARRLAKPEELLTLDERLAITFVQGMRPILTRLDRYYEGRIGPSRFRGLKVFCGTTFMLLMGTVCAWGVTFFLGRLR